jgi:hypothetical protein
MHSDNAAAQFSADAGTTRRFFTVESANRSLVLVRKVVADIVAAYAELMELRAEAERSDAKAGEHLSLRDRIERAADRMRGLHDELSELGCELKDAVVGLIDFPAIHQGRKVCLCWKLNEPAIAYWHEEDAGFAGRKPIEAGFDVEGEQHA